MKKLFLGCIADDYTGASDLASFLVQSGMRTLLINTLPDVETSESKQRQRYQAFDAIVIAHKNRTSAAEEAVAESLHSLSFLQSLGCSKFYFKYCSTFDSTEKGNIGPVIDALLKALNEDSTIICPALPINGRSVYKGHLFVLDKLLQDSSMREHPLTPMTDSSIVRLLESQAEGKAASVPIENVWLGESALKNKLDTLGSIYRYIVVDAITMNDLKTIGHSVSNFTLVTGGSGLAFDLCHEFESQGFERKPSGEQVKKLASHSLILSGSCSAMTQQQVNYYSQKAPSLKLDPLNISSGVQTFDEITRWLAEHIEAAPLIYATADAESVHEAHQRIGFEQSQNIIEQTIAEIAVYAKAQGIRNYIVAGGETSGAVVSHLGFSEFVIGESVAPGVPLISGVSDNSEDICHFVLKSGNFGDTYFFTKALEVMTA